VSVDGLLGRLGSDKKAIHGKVHFVLPVRIGETRILSGVDPDLVRRATETALAEVAAQ
jgi:3-dehydroquinate synthase